MPDSSKSKIVFDTKTAVNTFASFAISGASYTLVLCADGIVRSIQQVH